MKQTTKRVLAVSMWAIVLFGFVGCISQLGGIQKITETVTAPGQTVTVIETLPPNVVEITLPPETFVVTHTELVDPVTITGDPITITSTLPADVRFRTITLPATTVEIEKTTTEQTVMTITTQQVITKTIEKDGDDYYYTTTRRITTTTTQLVCPSGWVIHPNYSDLGCMPLEDAKELSAVGQGVGGFSWLQIIIFVGFLGLLLFARRRKQ